MPESSAQQNIINYNEHVMEHSTEALNKYVLAYLDSWEEEEEKEVWETRLPLEIKWEGIEVRLETIGDNSLFLVLDHRVIMFTLLTNPDGVGESKVVIDSTIGVDDWKQYAIHQQDAIYQWVAQFTIGPCFQGKYLLNSHVIKPV